MSAAAVGLAPGGSPPSRRWWPPRWAHATGDGAWSSSRAPATSCAGRSPRRALGLRRWPAGWRARHHRAPSPRSSCELRRAGLALEDLAAAQAGRRAATAWRRVAVADAAARRSARVWRPVARALGRELALEWRETGVLRARRSAAARAGDRQPRSATRCSTAAGASRSRSRAGWRSVRIEVSDEGPGLRDRDRRAGRARERDAGATATASRSPAAVARRHGGRVSRRRPRRAGRGSVLELPAWERRRDAAAQGAAAAGLALLLGGLACSDVARARRRCARGLGPSGGGRRRAARPRGRGRRSGPCRLAVREVPARYAPRGRGGRSAPRWSACAPPRRCRRAPTYRSGARRRGVRARGRGARSGAASAWPRWWPPRRAEPGRARRARGRARHRERRDGRARAHGPGARGRRGARRPRGRGPERGRRRHRAARVAASLRVTLRQAVYLAAAQAFARELRLLPRAAGDRGRAAAPDVGRRAARGGVTGRVSSRTRP